MHRKTRKKRAKSRQNTGILGIKTWKMANIAENDRKVGIRTRQGFGELIIVTNQQKNITKIHLACDYLGIS